MRPKNPDVYRLLAMAYETKGDIPNTILNNNKYADILKTEISFAKEKGLNIKME